MNAGWPDEWLSIFSLESEGARTKLTVRWRPINATDAERAAFLGETVGMTQGWSGTFDQLAEYLASQ